MASKTTCASLFCLGEELSGGELSDKELSDEESSDDNLLKGTCSYGHVHCIHRRQRIL